MCPPKTTSALSVLTIYNQVVDTDALEIDSSYSTWSFKAASPGVPGPPNRRMHATGRQVRRGGLRVVKWEKEKHMET